MIKKNNKRLMVYVVAGIALLIIGGLIVLSSGEKTNSVSIVQVSPEDAVLTMKPEEIGLSLTATAGNRKAVLKVDNTAGISGLDYELSYTSRGDIPRGVIGHIDIKQAGKKVLQEITLGTCSDVCHYDEDVSDIKLILKVEKTDGTTAQVEKTLELE